jgi:hypothetical protein
VKSSKVLFICKRREDYNDDSSYSHEGVSTGLLNSARFVSDMLSKNGIESKISIVQDNNCIDREVTAFKPTHVIIEALWVVPEKFEILTKLHPNVKWIVRYHSEIPFVATEGIAMNWLFKFIDHDNVAVSGNSTSIQSELKFLIGHHFNISGKALDEKVIFLPNYYDCSKLSSVKKQSQNDYVSVGCFGAIRPLKNHLLQAITAIRFAERIGKKLHFHINSGRVEGNGDPVLKNLRELFSRLKSNGHQLIEHQWMPHDQFMEMLKAEIDIGVQISFSETFNIVAADMVAAGIPIVTSDEVKWSSFLFNADPASSASMLRMMLIVWNARCINVKTEQYFLKRYVKKSELIWKRYL